MPTVDAPQQQQPMELAAPGDVVAQQPAAEPEMTMRGGFVEECDCCCCGEECICC
ncbi:hypothetical protein B0H63DRAFT_461821 [Podospora didyma]|uniref:Metallothionein n=1 Tax=Podospora didyma TaxID=330526 RepID=A0AAE0P7E8_9PEZI|nr:hypothetical protein B0H63DRAFT_461821 [Podospora didyma]